MIFGEGPIIKNIAGDLNKLFLQGSRVGQPINNVEGDAAADQGTADLLAAMDPVIQEVAVGMSGEESRHYTVSGTPPLAITGSLGKPLASWSVELLPYQEGAGDPSPTNIRIIHGTNKLNLFVEESYDQSATPKAVIDVPPLGKNLLNAYTATWKKWELSANTFRTRLDSYPLINYTQNPNQTVSVTSTDTWKGICVEINAEPYERVVTATGAYRLWLYDKYEDGATEIAGGSGLSRVIPANTGCVAAMLFGASGDYTCTIQLENGSTPTSYEPCVNTIYNGTFGSNGGVSRWLEADLGKITWNAHSSLPNVYTGFGQNLPRWEILQGYGVAIALCSEYKLTTSEPGGVDAIDFSIALGTGGSTSIYVHNSAVADIDEFRTAISGVQLAYKLQNPVQFQITAPTVTTPSGNAETWATAEDGIVDSMEVTYVGKA